MLSETITNDQITILEDGQIQIRRATRIFRDGVFLSESYHRRVISPGDDMAGESDARIQGVAQIIHTPQVVTTWVAKQALERARN